MSDDDPLEGTGLALPPSLSQQGPPPTTPKSAVQEKDQPYERPEQPIGHTPRNPLESMKNFALGIGQGGSELLNTTWSILTNAHDKLPNGDIDPQGERDKWLGEWGRISKRPDLRQEAEMKVLKDTGKMMIDPFKDDKGNWSLYHALWEDPAGAANSVYFLRDLAGGTLKASGQLAGGRSLAGMSAKEIASLGKLNAADRLMQAGEAVSKVNPIGAGAGKLADLALRKTPLGDVLGIGPETKNISAVIGNIKAEEDIAAHARAVSLAQHMLSEPEVEQFNNLVDLGRGIDHQMASERVKDYFNAYVAKLQGPMERDLTEAGFLTPEQKLGARAQQASYRLYGDMEPEHVQEMLGKIKNNEINPTYRHFATKKGDWFEGLDKLVRENTGAQGTVGFLEGRTGGGDYIKNPIEAAMVQNDLYRQFNIRKRMVDEVTAALQEKGLARAIKSAKDLKPGENIVPVDFWKKYLETGQRAGGVAIAEKLRGADNASAVAKALEGVLKDREALGTINHAKDIAMPAYAARHLAMELGIPGALGRTYDKLFRYWKQGVTVFKPAYWMNVAAGNGVLAAIHGVRLDDALRSFKYRDLLPAELRSSIQTVLKPGQGPISKRYNLVANKLGQLDGALHKTMVHAPIYATNVEDFRRAAVDASKNLHKAGSSYFLTQDIINDPAKWMKIVSAGPGDYAKALDNKVLYQEQIARSISGMREMQEAHAKELANLQKLQKGYEVASTSRGTAELPEIGTPAAEGPREVYPDQPNPKNPDPKKLKTVTTTDWHPPHAEASPEVYPSYQVPKQSAATQAVIRKMQESGQRAAELEYLIKARQAEGLEAANRLGMVKESIPQIERIRQIAEDAIEPLNNFGGDYNRMHPLERTVFRRMVPFYAWSKAMTKLVATLPYTYPSKMFLWNRWSQMMADAHPADHHPAWLQGALPIFDCADGDTIYMRPNWWNPLERTLQTSRIGDTEMPNLFDVWSAHPFLKIGTEMKGGIDQVTMKPWKEPINGVRRDTGEVYTLNPDGTQSKVLAQPSLLRSLYHLFPYSQYVDALLLRAKQEKEGWAGSPEPHRGPDGEIDHPTTFLQNLRDMMTPARSTNFEEADRMEMRNQVMNIKGYEQEIRKERDPEKREKMITILQDYVEKWQKKR